MRTLSETLEAAQQATSINALVKLVLTHGGDSYTYTKTRILDITETEDGELQSLEIVLDNSDKALNDISFKGFKGVLSTGVTTGGGDEYSACAPMWVIDQRFDSAPRKLVCTLSLIGIFNRMALDKAATSYEYSESHPYTVKELITQVIETGSGVGACFTQSQDYSVTWEDGYDELADTYEPEEAFRVSPGANRKSVFDKLMSYTKNVARVEDDGYIHIFLPYAQCPDWEADTAYSLNDRVKPTTSNGFEYICTTAGTSHATDEPTWPTTEDSTVNDNTVVWTIVWYDYEYSLESGHTFFSKAYRDKLVIPNRFYVRNWPRYGPPYYDGEAYDSASYNKLPMTRYLLSVNVGSDAEAQEIAEAKLAIAQMWCEAGSAPVPNNVGQEIYDYINVTDEREDDERAGHIGQIIRHINLEKNEWRMTFVLGNWQNVRKSLDKLGITESDLETYFEELIVNSLYANNIYASTGDFVWWAQERGVGLDGINGAAIYGSSGTMALRTYPTDDDYFADTNLQCYVGTDGKIYGVEIYVYEAYIYTSVDIVSIEGYDEARVHADENGITLNDATLRFYLPDDPEFFYAGCLGVSDSSPYEFCIQAMGGNPLYLGTESASGADIWLNPDSNYVLPYADDDIRLGSTDKQFYGGYFKSRLKIPVGEDMYD